MQTDASSATRRTQTAEWMLIATTACWGISFPLLKDWIDAGKTRVIGPTIAYFTVIVLRMAIAMLVLGLVRPRLIFDATWREHRVGIILGFLTFFGAALQGIGMIWASPADSAFITSLSSVWVPLFAWVVFRIHVPLLTIAGLTLGMIGVFVLSVREMSQGHWGYGESFTVGATIVFAIQILLLDRLGKGVNSAHISTAFFAIYGLSSLVCALVLAWKQTGLSAWVDCVWKMVRDPALARALLVLAVVCTVMAFHWMNTYQPRTSASRAALIYLLEPLWAALFSLLLGHDQLTAYLVAGGALILAGNLLVEIPRWKRERAAARADQATNGRITP